MPPNTEQLDILRMGELPFRLSGRIFMPHFWDNAG